MGSGNTLVEGVRRWFQRRSSSSSTTIISDNPNYHNNISNKPNKNNKPNNNNSNGIVFNDNNDSHVSVTDLRAQSSTSHKREQRAGKEEELKIVEEDFDVIVLKLIKVPKRTHLRAGSMDSQKKVMFDSFVPFYDMGLLGF